LQSISAYPQQYISPIIGEYNADRLVNSFKRNGDVWYMGSNVGGGNGTVYDVTTFRVKFDFQIQRVNFTLWMDYEIWKER
jgi:hypothetical protein